DFSDKRRDEVIEYVREKYGKEHVAQIITFGTFAPRSILRELIKTIGINQPDAYFIMKHIPTNAQKRIVNYVEESNELKQYIKQSECIKLLFTIAEKLVVSQMYVSTTTSGVDHSNNP